MGHIVKAGVGGGSMPKATTAELVALLVKARAQAKEAAVVMARKMAEKIVGHAVAVEPTVMRSIVGQALEAASLDKSAVSVRVHPDDLATLQADRGEWLRDLGARARLTFVADDAVGRCGCIVETVAGRVDARLDVQLAALELALRRAAGNGP